MGNRSEKLIANNKKAYHDYEILETYEAGIDLAGTEVKSMRMGKCSIKEAYVRIDDMQAFVYGMHISPYEKGNIFNRDPLRTRRLLLHKNEIRKLAQQVQKQGYTLVPLSVYLKNGRMKLSLGVCVGKHLHDKRDAMAERTAKRDMERALRNH